jgi:DNA polymerase-3 subunit delta
MSAARSRSGPTGRAALTKVRKSLEKGWKPGVTVLTGDDHYHLDAAQKELIGALVPQEDAEYGLTVYGEQKVDVTTVVSAARSLGMFADRRVVLVRDASALDGDPRSLVEFAAHPPASSFLIVRAPKLDKRRKMSQALIKKGTVLSFDSPDDPTRALPDILEMAKAKDLQLERAAAALLAEVCRADYYRVDAELEKIACWFGTGKRKKVGIDLIREIASGSGLLSGWEVADAVLEKDRGAALAAMRQALDNGTAPLLIVGGLAYRARSMLQAKVLIDGGMPPDRACRTARLWGAHPAIVKQGLERYTVKELTGFASGLLEADRTLKSRQIAPAAVLESLIDRLTGRGVAGARA